MTRQPPGKTAATTRSPLQGPTHRTLERERYQYLPCPGPGNDPSCDHAVMFSTHCSAPPGPDQWVDTVDTSDHSVDILRIVSSGCIHMRFQGERMEKEMVAN